MRSGEPPDQQRCRESDETRIGAGELDEKWGDPAPLLAWCGVPRRQVAYGSGRSVAEEACETLRWIGVEVALIQDVGVAGPHRLDPHLALLRTCDAVIVIAGMEGALPSVVGGHIACPVIADS